MTDSAIKYSNFVKAGNCTDEIFAAASEPKKCEYCGKEYIKTEWNVYGQTKIVYSVPCDCIDKKQAEKKEEDRKERLRKRFQKANIGKRYIGMTLEKLEEMGTEHVADALKYVENFNSESGNSVHMIGDFGNGKTSVGYAMTAALLQKGFNCVALSWNDICSRFYQSKNFNCSETAESILEGLNRFDLVMLDEFVINIRKEDEAIFATELFDRFYKDNKCFLLINNPCDIQDMKTVPKLGKLLDRVREQAELWIFQHESYREKK